MSKAMNGGIRFAHEHIDLWMTYINAVHRLVKAEEPSTALFQTLLDEFRSTCQQAAEFLPTGEFSNRNFGSTT
jgi:hypothetical protein